jgi:hypothetical protein
MATENLNTIKALDAECNALRDGLGKAYVAFYKYYGETNITANDAIFEIWKALDDGRQTADQIKNLYQSKSV